MSAQIRDRESADEAALTPAVVKWAGIGSAVHLGLVVLGHFFDPVYDAWPWPSLVVAAITGASYAAGVRRSIVDSLWHGGMVGGICAFLGVALAASIADVAPRALATLTPAAILIGAGAGWLVFVVLGRRVSPESSA